MKKILLTITFVLLVTVYSAGQDYKTGVGLRLGFSNGLAIKHFIGHRSAFEGILVTRWRGFEMTGLYELHNQAFDIERLNWYFGFGGHIGFWNGDNTPWGERAINYTIIGVDGILGIEYSFRAVPINVGLDWKPAVNLSGFNGFWPDEGALSIRYIF